MRTKINNELTRIFKTFGDKYFIDDKLNKAKIIVDLENYDEELLESFFQSELIKSNFTVDISGNTIIQINKLIAVFEADEYWQDSYTKYSKKIGLTVNGKFLDESTDVVLDFPYKDTVLKASMSKEDTDKDDLRADEPFLNEVIAKEEIDVLFDKKLLVNAKRYDADGVHDVNSFDIEDNLILKGNNLLALHTLKEEYSGKVKFIYIDPPYNTGSDSFLYNDKFNHSTWLTFIKNRLLISKELLKEDGVICIQCDDNENAYLKVLLDEIFGVENFVNNIAIKMSEASGTKLAHSFKKMPKIKEYILIYKKGEVIFNPIKVNKNKWDDEYNKVFINFTKKDKDIIDNIKKKEEISYLDLQAIDNILKKVKITSINEETKELNKEQKNKWLYENSYKIFRTAASSSVKTLVDEKKQSMDQNIFSVISKKNNLYIGTSNYSKESKSPRVQVIFAEDNMMYTLGDMWTDINTTGLEVEGNVSLKKGKKPEKILNRLISWSTKENDIVLDFFMGSGTTQSVAHKMGRKYIGIEQMDYISTLSVPRLQKVIEGEQSGISKDVDWQGGGSFVYVELMEKNRGFLKSIQNAETQSDLNKLFEFMLNEAEIDFRVDLEKFKESIHELTLLEQKRLLIKILDKNQLYYNYSEIDDENVRDLISDNDYEFNKSFYRDGCDE